MRRVKWALTIVLTAAIGIVVATVPVAGTLNALIAWLDGLGTWGPVLFVVVYVAACVLCVPGSPLSMGAGFAFGLPVALVAVSLGSVLGATAAFLLGRTVARGAVERWLATNPRFASFDRALSAAGFRFVFLIRLSPAFPFNLLNYAFGLTAVSLRDYVIASWLAMLPGTLMYVYIGTTFRSLTDVFAGNADAPSWGRQSLWVLGMLATVAATIVITRAAQAALRAETASKPPGPGVAAAGSAPGAISDASLPPR